MRRMKTKKEINHRIYEIFNNSENDFLTKTESARIDELCWIQGIDRGNLKLGVTEK